MKRILYSGGAVVTGDQVADAILEYASELAPEGRVAQYMGLANVPWILAKGTTGLYSGWMLEHYCPKVGPKDTETMWLIYGFIALSTPIGLVLARSWVKRGPARVAPARSAG
jgi:hypothetical protein